MPLAASEKPNRAFFRLRPQPLSGVCLQACSEEASFLHLAEERLEARLGASEQEGAGCAAEAKRQRIDSFLYRADCETETNCIECRGVSERREDSSVSSWSHGAISGEGFEAIGATGRNSRLAGFGHGLAVWDGDGRWGEWRGAPCEFLEMRIKDHGQDQTHEMLEGMRWMNKQPAAREIEAACGCSESECGDLKLRFCTAKAKRKDARARS